MARLLSTYSKHIYIYVFVRYGALSGFGLSLAKWTLIVKNSTDFATGENAWLWWIIAAFGMLVSVFDVGLKNEHGLKSELKNLLSTWKLQIFFWTCKPLLLAFDEEALNEMKTLSGVHACYCAIPPHQEKLAPPLNGSPRATFLFLLDLILDDSDEHVSLKAGVTFLSFVKKISTFLN